jgi:hypothetical protein
MAQDLIIPLRRPQAYRFYYRLAWRGSRRVQIASDDLGIDFPLQLILKQARAVKSRFGLEWTQEDSFNGAQFRRAIVGRRHAATVDRGDELVSAQ